MCFFVMRIFESVLRSAAKSLAFRTTFVVGEETVRMGVAWRAPAI